MMRGRLIALVLIALLVIAGAVGDYFYFHNGAASVSKTADTASSTPTTASTTPAHGTVVWQLTPVAGSAPLRTQVTVHVNGLILQLGSKPGACAEIGTAALLADEFSAVQCIANGSGEEIGAFMTASSSELMRGTYPGRDNFKTILKF